MKTILNRTRRPIKVPLPGGKTLHLGPLRTGQVSDHAVELAAFRKLVDDGEIEVLGEGEVSADAPGPKTAQESTQGHRPPSMVMPKGNR